MVFVIDYKYWMWTLFSILGKGRNILFDSWIHVQALVSSTIWWTLVHLTWQSTHILAAIVMVIIMSLWGYSLTMFHTRNMHWCVLELIYNEWVEQTRLWIRRRKQIYFSSNQHLTGSQLFIIGSGGGHCTSTDLRCCFLQCPAVVWRLPSSFDTAFWNTGWWQLRCPLSV